MIDPALAYAYFGLPTTVGLIGWAMVKLHERSAPQIDNVTDKPGADRTKFEVVELDADFVFIRGDETKLPKTRSGVILRRVLRTTNDKQQPSTAQASTTAE